MDEDGKGVGKGGGMYQESCGQENCNFLQVSFEILLKFELDVIIFRENSYQWENVISGK